MISHQFLRLMLRNEQRRPLTYLLINLVIIIGIHAFLHVNFHVYRLLPAALVDYFLTILPRNPLLNGQHQVLTIEV